jgi:hypothetical protein
VIKYDSTATPAFRGDSAVEFGSYVVAQDYYSAHASYPESNPPAIMHDSVVAEEEAHPLHIGGKVSILEVSPTGSDWKEKGECK